MSFGMLINIEIQINPKNQINWNRVYLINFPKIIATALDIIIGKVKIFLNC